VLQYWQKNTLYRAEYYSARDVFKEDVIIPVGRSFVPSFLSFTV